MTKRPSQSDLPVLSSGAVGGVSFAHMNRVFDATRRSEAQAKGKIPESGGPRRSFFAKLVAEVGTIGSDTTWSWEEVGVDSGATTVDNQTGQMASADFDTGLGLAVALNGASATAGDIVLMHELPGFDGVRRYAFSNVTTGKMQATWAQLNATQSGGTITTGVAPTDLGDGVFVYKAVPVKITGYSAGAFTVAVDDDPRFAPSGSYVTLYNVPTHWNTADWKYAGVSTDAGSEYPAGFDVMGIGQDQYAATWHSPVIQIWKYQMDEETVLWLFMAEPDHDGSCTDAGVDGFAPAFFGGS